MAMIGTQLRYFIQARTIPDTISSIYPPGGFEKLEQTRLLWQYTDLGVPRKLSAIGENQSHEPGICLTNRRGIVFVVYDSNPNELPYPKYHGTSQRVGCIDPLRPPFQYPKKRPAKEKKILKFLHPAAFDKPDPFDMYAGMRWKFKVKVF